MTSLLLSVIALFVAIVIHEFAHGFMADRLGDPTPRVQGRLTLNPIAHIDLYGTIIVPFLLIIFGSPFVIGWAKPVMFDPYNLEKPKRDTALISLAGPVSNLILATILSAVLYLTRLDLALFPVAMQIISPFIFLNVLLAIFNLIPIHPLDGGKILVGLLPDKDAHQLDLFMRRYGFIILILIIFPWSGISPAFALISPIIRALLSILIPGGALI